MNWKTSRRTLSLERSLVMGILNVTPDSFSDGGEFLSPESAIARAEAMVDDGVDIIDIGGESTRPGSERISEDEEVRRTASVIEAIVRRFHVAVSIDTSRSAVARAAVEAGAEIINDISGLRFDPDIAKVAASSGAGLVLMHSRGEFEEMHRQPPVEEILLEVVDGLKRSIAAAREVGVADESIVLDVGIGFGKSPEQNLELIAKLDRLVEAFQSFPILVGASRKSFIAKAIGGDQPVERLTGSLVAAALAVWNGAKIVRVHDVSESIKAVRMADAIRRQL